MIVARYIDRFEALGGGGGGRKESTDVRKEGPNEDKEIDESRRGPN